MFDKLKKKFSEVFSGHGDREVVEDKTVSKDKPVDQGKVIRRADLEDTIQETLLESDVSFDATEEIIEQLKANLGKIKRKVDYSTVQDELKKVIRNLIDKNNNQIVDLVNIDKKPYVILFLGINGTGKTTTIGKLAYYLYPVL